MSKRWLLLLIMIFVISNGVAQATSLWEESNSLFVDIKARNVGDLLTLIIVEHSQATQSAETSSGQSSQVSFGPGLGLLAFVPEIRVGGGDESKAGGRTTRGGSLTARMTTQVIDILPNGNLIIEGRQVILINGEEQELIVSGMVRPRDIQKDNTVLSTYLADAQIAFTGTGAIGDKQQPGILTRLFNWLF